MIDPGVIAVIDQDQAFAEEVLDGMVAFFRGEDIRGVKLAYAAAAIHQEFTPNQMAYLVVVALQQLAKSRRQPDAVDLDRLLDNIHDGMHNEEIDR